MLRDIWLYAICFLIISGFVWVLVYCGSEPTTAYQENCTTCTLGDIYQHESKNALIIVDMQNFFWNSVNKEEREKEFPNYLEIIKRAKEINLPIVILEFANRGKTVLPIASLLEDYPNKMYITKRRSDGFRNTVLLEKLNLNDAKTLILVGVYASACVKATAESAVANKFKIVLSEETMSDGRFGTSQNIRDWYQRSGKLYQCSQQLIEYINSLNK